MLNSRKRCHWTRSNSPTSRQRSSACQLHPSPRQRAETRPVRLTSCRATLSAYQLYRPTLRPISRAFIFSLFYSASGCWRRRGLERERESTLWWIGGATAETKAMIRTLYFSPSSLRLDIRAAWARNAKHWGLPVFYPQRGTINNDHNFHACYSFWSIVCLYICRLKLGSGQNEVKWRMQQKFGAYLGIFSGVH